MFSTPTPNQTTRPSVRTPSSASSQYKKRWSKGQLQENITPSSNSGCNNNNSIEDRLTPHQLTPAEVDVVHQSLMRETRSPGPQRALSGSGSNGDCGDMDIDMDCDSSFLNDNTAPSGPESPTKAAFDQALSEETLGASAESARKSLKTKQRVQPPLPSQTQTKQQQQNALNNGTNVQSYAEAVQNLYSGGSAPASKAVCDSERARGFFSCSEAVLCGGSSNSGRSLWGGNCGDDDEYSLGGGGGVSGSGRYVSRSPERILDAPELRDDYYLNLIDWSVKDNVLAVALGKSVYLWNADTGVTHTLPIPPSTITATNESSLINSNSNSNSEDSYIASVRWMRSSSGGGSQYLSVGTSGGTVQLWDCNQLSQLRSMGGHSGRVSSLSWMDHLVASGSRDTTVAVHDVRRQQHLAAVLCGHQHLEVCGLEWAPSGQQLASGGNDNVINIWDTENLSYSVPRFTFAQHTAAVKALAWCPWQQNLLASGGGTADRCVRFWNTESGACLRCVETGSQVTSLQWSLTYRELVSAHGYSKNQLTVWKYPSMEKVADLVSHERRILHTARSPDSSVIVSAGADETLRFWKIWPVPTAFAKSKGFDRENALLSSSSPSSSSSLLMSGGSDGSAFYAGAYKR